MATSTATLFYRGAAATSSTTLYTVPANTTSVLTDIVISSTDSAQQSVTITVDGVVLIPAVPVPSNSVVNFQFKSVIAAGKIVAGYAGSTNVNFHISGVQIA
jgi:hypothetical protein